MGPQYSGWGGKVTADDGDTVNGGAILDGNDVIDYGRLKDGVERSALYFSMYSLMTKVQLAIGGALGFAIVGWFGLDVQAVEQTELSVIGLWLSVSWAPTFFVLVAMVFIVMMPLNESRIEIIRRKLKIRDARQNTDRV